MKHIVSFIALLNIVYAQAWTAEFYIEDDKGNVIGDASIYMIYKDGTYECSVTRRSGYGKIVPKRIEQVTLLVGGKGIKGYILAGCDNTKDMTLKIQNKEGGSVVFEDGSGKIIGIEGTINPILDTSGRTYVYGRGLSINDGAVQPVKFKIDEVLHIKDSNKMSIDISIGFIQHRIVLVDYSVIRVGG